MAFSPFAKIHNNNLDHRLLNRFASGVAPAGRIPDVARIRMPEQSAQSAFWYPFAARWNQVAPS
ncbi:hypothetical protein XAP412_1430017 [Xanthomonas phaseoli pv. phaseoli]|uniref:Uncharacterized protein n=1 Tax=Xanthomonas campestris pv. phaseoli TaxID=317013 RepID=A0AB38DWK7_XANCH|nr:hypothetical protein XAP6984_1570005 [Xanthomonas phaseoli pv. phaseoli]SON80400.1 hypothetical protein XAP412_1430017 [Xanthomonas phaseoli pv. phaseoli]SON83973.1 hypothetical protein XAP7430_1500001 [Xanthomonas phaseoli pv. phaseoli]SOO31017.1 hypothetical protein XAP6164_4940020 [Xanthomonas phaseoli pv. phaseoli]